MQHCVLISMRDVLPWQQAHRGIIRPRQLIGGGIQPVVLGRNHLSPKGHVKAYGAHGQVDIANKHMSTHVQRFDV